MGCCSNTCENESIINQELLLVDNLFKLIEFMKNQTEIINQEILDISNWEKDKSLQLKNKYIQKLSENLILKRKIYLEGLKLAYDKSIIIIEEINAIPIEESKIYIQKIISNYNLYSDYDKNRYEDDVKNFSKFANKYKST